MKKITNKLNLNARLSLLMPYFIIAILFIILPTIFLFIKAFSSVGGDFNNWKLIQEWPTWKIIIRSVIIGLITAFICLLIGLPYAYSIAISKSKHLKIYGIIFMILPMFIFTLAKVLAIKGLFSFIFSNSIGVEYLNQSWFMVIGLVYLNLPFIIIPLYSVFSTMPKSLTEASHDLGYSHLKTLIKVVVPYGIKAIFSGLALVFMLAATTLVISNKLLPDGTQHTMIGNLIATHAQPQNKFEVARASTLALVTTGVMLGIYGIIYLLPQIVRKLKGGINA